MGITNGAIYALLALALVLAFAVTRVIFIPQGEFVAYGALTLVALQGGRVPGTVWLLLVAGVLVALIEAVTAFRTQQWRRFGWVALWNLAYPLGCGRCSRHAGDRLADAAADPAGAGDRRSAGPMVYRLAYQPIAEAAGAEPADRSRCSDVVMLGLGC